MKIAICSSLFHPIVGGAETKIFKLAIEWVNQGHEVIVITRETEKQKQYEKISDVRICRVVKTWNWGPLFGLSFVLKMAWQLWTNRSRWDIAITSQGPWEGIATGLIKIFLRRPTFVMLATSGPFGDLAKMKQIKGRFLLWRLLKRNDRFLALSDYSMQEMDEYKIPEKKRARVTYPVDCKTFKLPDPKKEKEAQKKLREKTVLFVGRLTEQKNPMGLLDAWKVANSDNQFRLLIAGEGHLQKSMQQKIVDENIQGVEFLGYRIDMPDVYRMASVFLSSSKGEGCCNALLEAMASGLVPVVTDIGSNRGIVIDGENGYLAAQDDATALGNAVKNCFSECCDLAQLSENAIKTMKEHHDPKTVAKSYTDLFESV